VQEDLFRHSHYVRAVDFTAIHLSDLAFLFDAYDERFFRGLCGKALDGRKLRFRLAPRMTRMGGKTTCFQTRAGEVSYEISLAVSLLFDGFGKTDRHVTVCGLSCENRLDALRRIFEHEMVHLIEHLCWADSNCAASRFQAIASRFFLHQAHTHNLVTRQERAAESGIRVGSCVSFLFQGQPLTGRVQRITKRATVLVEDPQGEPYANGLRYKTYYVPVASLVPTPLTVAS